MTDRWAELERLARLKSEGALTEDEFEAEKQRLLTRRASWRTLLLGSSLAVLAITSVIAVMRRPDAPAAPPAATAPAALPPSTATDGASDAPLTLSGAFDLVYPASTRKVTAEGTTVTVRFRPHALYRLGADTLVLIAKGENRDEDHHASAGFYAVTYLRARPRPTIEGNTFIGVGSKGGWGLPPDLKIVTDLTPRPLLQVTSSSSGQGRTASVADLVWLGPTVADVRVIGRGIALTYDDLANDGTCEIRGRLAPSGPDSFKVVYSGSYVGEAIYQNAGSEFRTAPGPDLYERCEPSV